jgi:hypothetical protein
MFDSKSPWSSEISRRSFTGSYQSHTFKPLSLNWRQTLPTFIPRVLSGELGIVVMHTSQVLPLLKLPANVTFVKHHIHSATLFW